MRNIITPDVLKTMIPQEFEDWREAGEDLRRELTHAVMRDLTGVSLDIENYCTLRWFFVPLSCGGALAALSEKRTSARSKKMPAFSCLYF